jgi:hypothetical protein
MAMTVIALLKCDNADGNSCPDFQYDELINLVLDDGDKNKMMLVVLW